jgi:hypothetical protein
MESAVLGKVQSLKLLFGVYTVKVGLRIETLLRRGELGPLSPFIWVMTVLFIESKELLI